MVTVMLMMLFLAVVSVGLWTYGRSLLTSAAAQAARYAANANITDPAAVSARAAIIMGDTIAGPWSDSVTCEAPDLSAELLAEVRCEMAAPAILPLLGDVLPAIAVTAHAVKETP